MAPLMPRYPGQYRFVADLVESGKLFVPNIDQDYPQIRNPDTKRSI